MRSIRAECLDHLIVINERHLMAVLEEFVDYYNRDRVGIRSPPRCLDSDGADFRSPLGPRLAVISAGRSHPSAWR